MKFPFPGFRLRATWREALQVLGKLLQRRSGRDGMPSDRSPPAHPGDPGGRRGRPGLERFAGGYRMRAPNWGGEGVRVYFFCQKSTIIFGGLSQLCAVLHPHPPKGQNFTFSCLLMHTFIDISTLMTCIGKTLELFKRPRGPKVNAQIPKCQNELPGMRKLYG